MTSDYVYRGNSLGALNESVFDDGRVPGRELTMFRGEIKDPPEHVPKGTPVDELPWWTPEGMDDEDGYYTETQGVTGGFTYNLGTAINFGSGIPMVLFLNERRLSCSRVRYEYDSMDAMPGSLAWVAGDFTVGEVRTESDGLIGLVGENPSGPIIESWGQRALDRDSMQYSQERECIVHSDSVNVSKSLEATASYFERAASPRHALDNYTEGDVPEDNREAAKQLHATITREANHSLEDYYVVALNTSLMQQDIRLDRSMVEYATDGDRVYDPEDVPGFLLGE